MINISVLGSTGSIGVSTLDVISKHLDKYRVTALSANTQVDRMLNQCQQFLPEVVVMVDHNSAEQLSTELQKFDKTQTIKVLSGKENLEYIASMENCDYVMAAIVGAAGLPSSLAAAKAGKRVMLANKESLVMSGSLFMQAVKEHGAELLPVDSEHNAIFQSLPENFDRDNLYHNSQNTATYNYGIEKILLTASGGPFRDKPLSELESVTPDQACAHPNWKMGRKISVDSATMMNKGLEVIEASWLFAMPADDIQVVIHPQSIIHSMVSYVDGSVIAQLGNPDMKTPIAYALAWPERIQSGVKQLDIFDIGSLDFSRADYQRFPCLKLAYDALKAGGSAATILNAANEVAVECFLQHEIPYLAIPKIVEHCLEKVENVAIDTLDTVYEMDEKAREYARSFLYDQYQIKV
ncbi:MAG: 1-deoxy-D-xylulose-5-phosphate reductoisomerase [Pseudomonadota bacterium]